MPNKRAASGPSVVLLAGGVGAARLLRGLAEVVDPSRLTVIVNTGDDESFYGLHVSPDLDTIVYTLAGLAPIQRGWGIRGDTFSCLEHLSRLSGKDWFALGDKDLATHIHRTEALRSGRTLSQATQQIAQSFGVHATVLPMTDAPLRTFVETTRGTMPFQDYLVRHRARPRVHKLRFEGARSAPPAPGVLQALASADLVVIAPSNPFTSIAPMLALKGFRAALRAARPRTVAVSPLIHGKAVKGPLASMLRSMGEAPGLRGIRAFYAGLARHLVVAPGDRPARQAREVSARSPLPELIEHDILLLPTVRARRLASYLVETFPLRESSR